MISRCRYPGESSCAFLGQSGSGKSTLMNILGCLDIPTYGSYHLNGQLVSDMKPSVLSGIRNRADRVYLSGL